jgi:hypothetical protein
LRFYWIAHGTGKTCGPSTTLCFAGIELDTIRFEARLPLEKLRKCVEPISDFQKGKKITLREIQSLIGLLNFACSLSSFPAGHSCVA